jgi:hypothetical protein
MLVKEILVRMFTGWRSAEYFGLPRPRIVIRAKVKGPDGMKQYIGSVYKDMPYKNAYSFVYASTETKKNLYFSGVLKHFYCETPLTRQPEKPFKESSKVFIKHPNRKMLYWKPINVK